MSYDWIRSCHTTKFSRKLTIKKCQHSSPCTYEPCQNSAYTWNQKEFLSALLNLTSFPVLFLMYFLRKDWSLADIITADEHYIFRKGKHSMFTVSAGIPYSVFLKIKCATAWTDIFTIYLHLSLIHIIWQSACTTIILMDSRSLRYAMLRKIPSITKILHMPVNTGSAFKRQTAINSSFKEKC